MLTLRGLAQEVFLSVMAVCVPGTGIRQITGVDGDTERVLQNVIYKRLRELGQEQLPPARLRVHITAGGAILDAATHEPLDLLMAVGDGTSRTATHELELLARGALERTVLTPLTNDTPHHVILADVAGDRITPVKLGCSRQYTPGNTFHVDVMLPGLDGMEGMNIICHPETARLLSGHRTTTTITSITRLEELPIALGVCHGDIQEALPLPVARPLPGLPSHHLPGPLVGCHFDVDTVSKINLMVKCPFALPVSVCCSSLKCSPLRHTHTLNIHTYMDTSQQVMTQEEYLELTGIAGQLFAGNRGGTGTKARSRYAAAVGAADARVNAGAAGPEGVAAADLLAGASLAAYVDVPFKENLTITQVPMRTAGISPAFLREAHRNHHTPFGFNTSTASQVAPPAPREVCQVFERIKAGSGDLLAGLVPVTIVCNRQMTAADAHVAHVDPSAYAGIVGVNLGQGQVTLTLGMPTDGRLVYKQTLKPGTA